MKTVSGRLKIDLAQFRALEAFAMFASDLDPASRQQLSRGQRLMELLKQGQYSPFPVEEQVVSIWLGTTGQLDDIAVPDVRRFESRLLEHLRRSSNVLTTIRETGKFEDDTAETLQREVDEFKKGFDPSDKDSVEAGHESRAPSATRRSSRRRSCGNGTDPPKPDGRAAAGLPAAHQLDHVDAQDLQRDGAHRHLTDQQVPGGRRGVHPVCPRHHPSRLSGGDLLQHRAPADHREGDCPPGSDPAAHQRPRHGGRLLLERGQRG
jgi:hypothetical protein